VRGRIELASPDVSVKMLIPTSIDGGKAAHLASLPEAIRQYGVAVGELAPPGPAFWECTVEIPNLGLHVRGCELFAAAAAERAASLLQLALKL
jgi:hypothetical protein